MCLDGVMFVSWIDTTISLFASFVEHSSVSMPFCPSYAGVGFFNSKTRVR